MRDRGAIGGKEDRDRRRGGSSKGGGCYHVRVTVNDGLHIQLQTVSAGGSVTQRLMLSRLEKRLWWKLRVNIRCLKKKEKEKLRRKNVITCFISCGTRISLTDPSGLHCRLETHYRLLKSFISHCKHISIRNADLCTSQTGLSCIPVHIPLTGSLLEHH